MIMAKKSCSILLSFLLVASLLPLCTFSSAYADTTTDNTESYSASSKDRDATSSVSNEEDFQDDEDTIDLPPSETNEEVRGSRQAEIETNQTTNTSEENRSDDPANSWRYQNGVKIPVSPEATTEDINNEISTFAAAPGVASYATWYKSNGATTYSWKAQPTDAATNISVPGAKRVGIDVSSYQGKIDWAKVKADGISFAILRCGTYSRSNRTHTIDTRFIENVKGARANGIDVGVYLYSYAQNITGSQSAESEAKNVLSFLKSAGLTPSNMALPVYYDLEDSSQVNFGAAKLGQMAKTFCDTISKQGYKVGIYANQNWWRTYLTDPVFSNSNWHKWVARYPGSNKANSSGVSGTGIWQFSDCGNVSGIGGYVDMNFDYTMGTTVPVNSKIGYNAHVRNVGWQSSKYDGAVSGTTGRALAVEAISLSLSDVNLSGSIHYRSHLQNKGWESEWVSDGAFSGTTGQARHIEALQIQLSGDVAKKYDVYYQVHVRNLGWLDWAKNGDTAGTSGYNYPIEAYKVQLVAKGGKAPGSTSSPYREKNKLLGYSALPNGEGWQTERSNGATAGTIGKAVALKGVKIALANQKYSGAIQYKSHIQNIGWETGWKTNSTISGPNNASGHIEAIQVQLTGEMANKYDVYYRVHVSDYGWMGWAKNGASAGTVGYNKPVEAIELQLVEKNKQAPGDITGTFKNSKALVGYTAHVRNIGWQNEQYDGATAGTTGKALAVEALCIKLNNPQYSGSIRYRSHLQNKGWESNWLYDGKQTGTTGQARHIEALQIQLTGTMQEKYDIYYRVHVRNRGWMGWAKNGAIAGTEGCNAPIEAIEIQLVTKGGIFTGSTIGSYYKK